MTWLTWLMIAAVLAAVAALTGLQPKGTRNVEGTHLMGVARVVLIVIAIIVAYAALHGRPGG
jgi:uncharacterized membrane protein YhaH (DUF805 family)